jgi:hypothetical protein
MISKTIRTQNQARRKDSFKNENEPFLLYEGELECQRKEKPENKIEENLSLRRRRIEMLNAKIKSPPDLKDKSPDRMIVT